LFLPHNPFDSNLGIEIEEEEKEREEKESSSVTVFGWPSLGCSGLEPVQPAAVVQRPGCLVPACHYSSYMATATWLL